jgi:hypothetical protein
MKGQREDSSRSISKLLAGTAHEPQRQQILILLAKEEANYQTSTSAL